MSIALGNPDFKIVDINPINIAKALQAYLDRGSQITGVSLDDIKTSLPKKIADPSKATLADLVGAGMKIFDALVWLSAGRPTSHPITHDDGAKESDIPSMYDVARAVFYNFFFILTQARYPAPVGVTEKPRVPKFLSTVMGMNDDQSHYVSIVCSFAPEKFNKQWVKHVKFKGLGQEAVSRFGLGVAGYRLFGPFKLYKPKPDLKDELLDAFAFAVKVAKAPATWDIHPATRAPNVLTKRGNLNKNLGNLILESFTDEQIDEMVQTKVLFSRPQNDPTARNYFQWAPEDDISGSAHIFLDI